MATRDKIASKINRFFGQFLKILVRSVTGSNFWPFLAYWKFGPETKPSPSRGGVGHIENNSMVGIHPHTQWNNKTASGQVSIHAHE